MNLFFAAWQPQIGSVEVSAEMHRLGLVYPQLDQRTLFCEGSPAQGWLAAAMQTSPAAATPRMYVARTATHLTLYDGLPLHPGDAFPAHDAAELDHHWDQLPDVLEGQYVAVRIALSGAPRLEVLVDALGMAQVYFWRQGATWYLSNSVRLIQRLSGATTPDRLGVGNFLVNGSAGGDRTLIDSVRVMPGGQRWIWEADDPAPRQVTYFDFRRLAELPRQAPTDAACQLTDELVPMFRTLSRRFGMATCLLTGGRDSRLVAALATAAGLPVRFLTSGHPDSAEVEVARQVARHLGQPHEVVTVTTESLARQWPEAAGRLVRQNDGLVSLWQIQDACGQPDQVTTLALRLWGVGSEIARNFKRLHALQQAWRLRDQAAVQAWLQRRTLRGAGRLVRTEILETIRAHVNEFVSEWLSAGFPSAVVPDVFHAVERVRRWGGSNRRKAAPLGDSFTPFCTRPYLRAAFSISATDRFLESLHFNTLRHLSPTLHAMPFLKQRAWLPQTVPGYLAWQASDWLIRCGARFYRAPTDSRKRPSAFDQAALLEARRAALREACLAWPDSPLWEFADRNEFTRVMAVEAEPRERSSRVNVLYNLFTLFAYFHGGV